MYIALGAAGLPVFTGFNSGTGVFFGPTAGYLSGYVLSAFIIGYVVDCHAKARKFLPMLNITLFCSALILVMVDILRVGPARLREGP
jgi:biotin transport system substrate-specific component